jgi:photosystem II stability/assembly factor-like uncharacterized protein
MRRALCVLTVFLSAAVLGAQTAGQSSKASAVPVKTDEPAARTPSPPEIAWKAISARSVGPAVMGGRISDISLDPQDPWTYYVATAHGGIMKTTDNGGSFTATTDKEAASSFGAVAVAPSDGKVVWAGSGEGNDRNSSGWGNGVYRSTDAAATWSRAGLAASKSIARIAVHPSNASIAYVAALGDLWNDSPERGLYKTSDGGKSWTLVLHAPAPDNVVTGAGDVVVDPKQPDTVYAVLYARRRTPWSFNAGIDVTGGRDVGGIYRSSDAGATWKKLTTGLPTRLGRIGLAIFPANPKIVYAVVQSDESGTQNINEVISRRGGVFRSDDGGDTWRRQSGLNPRPFYFSQIRVDPQNEQTVYVLGFMLHVSEDGGRTWREDRFKKLHPDCHALAIDVHNPKRLLLGTDGGVYQTYDRGASWAHMNTMAIGEYYRIAVDSSTPYRICGGLQDNLNWVGPSATRSKDGILNSDWTNVTGGDGFYCAFDPTDPDIVYAESQGGEVHRFNLKSGAVKGLRPEPAEGQPAFRFHWNSPLIASRHTKGTMYLAGNRVFTLTESGEAWRPISPDLSAMQADRIMTSGSGAETYGVVYALAESPRKAGMLWAGTDDGKLWVTEDGGTKWSDLTGSLPAATKGQWITRVEPGWADERTAYMVVSAFRSGNYAPLVYRTADLGKSWQSLGSKLPQDWPARVVCEDPSNPNLLFVGTEIGLYVSFDRGLTWAPFGNLPIVPVEDLAIQPKTHDLVIATHGRSLYVVDDISPLEQLTPAMLNASAHLFPVAPAFGFEPLPGWSEFAGSTGAFHGANPPVGASINVWVKQFTGDTVSVTVKTASGQPVATLTAPGVPGFARVVWNLKPTKDVLTEYGGGGEKFVAPGEYEVTLTYGKLTETQKMTVEIGKGLETR